MEFVQKAKNKRGNKGEGEIMRSLGKNPPKHCQEYGNAVYACGDCLIEEKEHFMDTIFEIIKELRTIKEFTCPSCGWRISVDLEPLAKKAEKSLGVDLE